MDACERCMSRALYKAESELMDFTSFGRSLYNLAPKYSNEDLYQLVRGAFKYRSFTPRVEGWVVRMESLVANLLQR